LFSLHAYVRRDGIRFHGPLLLWETDAEILGSGDSMRRIRDLKIGNAPAQFLKWQGGSLMRRSQYISSAMAAAIALFGTLASLPAMGQVVTPTTLSVRIARAAGDLQRDANGAATLDLITQGGSATYAVTVTNTGPSRAFGVTLTGNAPVSPPTP